MRIATPVSTPTKKGTVTADVSFNGVTFTAQKVRTFQLGSFADTVTPKYRETLAGKALFELRNQAVEPLEPCYSLSLASIKITSNSNFFANNNKIMTQLYALRSLLTSFCMDTVLDILPVDASGALDTTGTVQNLLDNACIVDEESVRVSNKMYAEMASEKIHPQNLVWTQDLLLSSCDATLRTDLEHRLVAIPDNEQGGPLVLHMILNQPMSTSHEAARAITNCLQALSVLDFQEKNIGNFCSTFNNAVLRLNVSGHVPSNITNILFPQKETCSVNKFTSLLTSLENIDDPILRDYYGSSERMLRKYNDLLLMDQWYPITKSSAAAFNTKRNDDSPSVSDTKHKSKTSESNSERKPTPIDTTPPAADEKNRKPHPRIPKKRLWWCAECPNGTTDSKGRWGNHSTNRHDPSKVGIRAAAITAANTIAATDPSTATMSLSSTATPDF